MSTYHSQMLDAVTKDHIRNKLTLDERAELLIDIDELTGTFHYTVMPDDSHVELAKEDIKACDEIIDNNK